VYKIAHLPDGVQSKPSRLVGWAFLYATIVVYSSLAVGPLGFHFVYIHPAKAWQLFLQTRYVENGSDQRADWIANLLLTVPLGFFAAGLIRAKFGGLPSRVAAILAFSGSVTFILAVKYAQLFFPPRTVTLNYITAQTIGSIFGIALFALSRTWRYRAALKSLERHDGLVIILRLYTTAIILYFLFPFDFVISVDDLLGRLAELPSILPASPGEGQSIWLRAVLIAADMAATLPIGMLLAVNGRGRSFFDLLIRGFVLMVGIMIVTMFIMGGRPYLWVLLYRTVGIGLGINFIARIKGRDFRWWHYRMTRFLPLAAIAYVVAVLFINEIVTSHWRTYDQAMRALDRRGLLPFWHYYISTKAHGAKSFMVHALTFAPIGIMVWWRREKWAGGGIFSAVCAFIFSLAIETGRWFKPGLQPDFSNPMIAAAAAYAAFWMMPILWRMLQHEATLPVVPRPKRKARGSEVAHDYQRIHAIDDA
jgi:VanZ family protein